MPHECLNYQYTCIGFPTAYSADQCVCYDRHCDEWQMVDKNPAQIHALERKTNKKQNESL